MRRSATPEPRAVSRGTAAAPCSVASAGSASSSAPVGRVASVWRSARLGGPPRASSASRAWRQAALTSFKREAEEWVAGALGEVDAARVVQRAGIALEALGQPSGRRRGPAGADPGVLGDEAVGGVGLGDVGAGAGHALGARAEDAGHGQR